MEQILIYILLRALIHQVLCGSDHFPIILEPVQPALEECNPRWIVSNADWKTFCSQCSDKMTFDLIVNKPNPIEIFSDTLITIGNETIPRTTSSPSIHKP